MYFFSNSPVKWRLTNVVCMVSCQLSVLDHLSRSPRRETIESPLLGSDQPFQYRHHQQARA